MRKGTPTYSHGGVTSALPPTATATAVRCRGRWLLRLTATGSRAAAAACCLDGTAACSLCQLVLQARQVVSPADLAHVLHLQGHQEAQKAGCLARHLHAQLVVWKILRRRHKHACAWGIAQHSLAPVAPGSSSGKSAAQLVKQTHLVKVSALSQHAPGKGQVPALPLAQPLAGALLDA